MAENAKPISGFIKIVTAVSPIIGLGLSFFSLKCALKDHHKYSFIYQKYLPKELTFEENVKAAFLGTALIGMVVIFNFILTILLRYATSSPNPLLKKDSEIVDLCNLIARNTIEQSIPFFTIYLAWALNLCNNENKHELFIYPLLWTLGRAIFIFGYIFQYFTKIVTLRAFGFSINVMVTLHLLVRLTGHDILTLVKY